MQFLNLIAMLIKTLRLLQFVSRKSLFVFLEPFSSPGCTYTIAGGFGLKWVVNNYLETKQILMLYFASDSSVYKAFRMLLFTSKNPFVVFLEPFPSPGYTYTIAGGCCLNRGVSIFLVTQQILMLFLKLTAMLINTWDCCSLYLGNHWLCF